MLVKTKLILSFTVIIIVFSGGSLLHLTTVRDAMIQTTGEGSVTFTRNISDRLDQRILGASAILSFLSLDPDVIALIEKSNSEFDQMDDRAKHMEETEAEWKSYVGQDNPLFNEMVKNTLSQRLESFRDAITKSQGVDMYPETIIANKYGATIAENNRTTDWDQSDRLQFQNARDKGWHVSDLYYDSSAGIWALEMAIGVTDNQGQFIGMIKTAYNIEDIIQIIEESAEESFYERSHVVVLSGDGKVIYDGKNRYALGDDASSALDFYTEQAGKEGIFFGDQTRLKTDELVAYTTSDGTRNFDGLGWVVAFVIDRGEFLDEIDRLQNLLIIILLSAIGIAIATLLIIVKSVIAPVKKVTDAANKISQGDFDVHLQVKGKDEISDLASMINHTAMALKKAEKEKNEFAAMITHELKTPLDDSYHP